MAANVAAFGVWEYDIGTDLITWDDTMFDIYGIPKITPMQYQLWVDRLHPEDRIRAEHSLQAIINELGREELEYRIIRPDNSIRYIQSIKTSLKDDTHQTIRLIGVNRDITERKRMEIELRNSEARYRSYFELPLTGRAVTSPTEGWLEVNATLCDMLGYTKTELTQMTWEELTYPDDLAADLVQFNRVMSGEIDGYTLEKRFIHKDGHSVHTHLAVNCLRKPDQAVDYIIALILDITERKQAEKSLRESEELLREMSRVAKVGGWNLDLKTHKLTWTEEVYRIREVDPNYQPQLKEGIDAFPPEARPILRESIKCAVNQGVSYDLELPFITAKGNHLWVRTIGNAEKLDGQIVRLFGVFQDITGRKRAEIALRESEEKFRLAFSNANTGMCQSICKEIYCKSTKK